jgi:DNA polymerase-3 subunit delta'
MSAAPPHPRDVFDLMGAQGPEAAFQSALDRGRLHHAWLLTGPEGVGKATFAYRAARRLLGAVASPAHGILGADPDDPVSRQIAARAHPDLMVLQRDSEDGKARKSIPVDEARALPEFFSKSPASAPYRVAIIDAADDLNVNAANAVLKTLEEPPPRGVLLLVSHSPGGLLATLRSRCRRLRFDAPPTEQAAEWVADRADVTPAAATRLLAMARGAVGRAWRLADAGALAIDDQAHELLRSLPKVDDSAMLVIAEKFRGAEGAARFEMLFDRLADQIHHMAAGQAVGGVGEARDLDRWAQAHEMLTLMPREAEALNLDRADSFFTALARLRALA